MYNILLVSFVLLCVYVCVHAHVLFVIHSASAVSHTRRFITTLVLGNDLVPRLALIYSMYIKLLPCHVCVLVVALILVGVVHIGCTCVFVQKHKLDYYLL